MTLEDFFVKLEIDGNRVLERFQGNQALLLYFLRKFPNDPLGQQIDDAAAKKDFEELERAAHTLKGVTANLGLDGLYNSCSKIVAAVRTADRESALLLIPGFDAEYGKVIDCLMELE